MKKLAVGDLVKIRLIGERFWVKISSVRKSAGIYGIIDNHLVNTEEHGYSYGDEVVFSKSEILDVY